MSNIISINGTNYEVSTEVFTKISTICETLGKVVTANTTKAVATTTEPNKVEAFTVDGKNVKVGGNGFVPRKVFYAITCSLKESGAKWCAEAKVWQFDTKKSCDAWVKAQKNRNK